MHPFTNGFEVGPVVNPLLLSKVVSCVNNHLLIPIYDSKQQIIRFSQFFGWNFKRMENKEFLFEPIPPEIVELRERVVQLFKEKLQRPAKPEDFDNVIVNHYNPNHFIIPHYDVDRVSKDLRKREYRFAESIIGVILKADSTRGLSFYYHEGLGQPSIVPHEYQLKEEDGLTYLIQGKARHAPYFHAVPKGFDTRLSITFRKTMIDEAADINSVL